MGPIEIFQYLGISEEMSIQEAQSIFDIFGKSNNPENLPANSSQEFRQLSKKVFSMVSSAYEVMIDEDKRKEEIVKTRKKKVQLQLQSQNLVDQGLKSLRAGEFNDALEKLQEAYRSYESQQTLLYLYWAELKQVKNLTPERSKKINNELLTFPPHYKRNEIYFFVHGLLRKSGGNIPDACEYFKKSLQVNPRFLDSKRELLAVAKEMNMERRQNLFTGDLSTVVSGFFKKKSGG